MSRRLAAAGAVIVALLSASPAGGQGIRGLVRDLADLPLEGAEIVLTGTDRSARTNAQGVFIIDGLDSRNYFLLVRKPGYSPARMQVPVGDTGRTEVEVYLRQVPFTLEPLVVQGTRRGLHGVVGDTTYRPAFNAKVEVLGGGAVAYTDSLGRFAFPALKGGTYMVRATLPGWVSKPVFVELPRNGSRELVIFVGREPPGHRADPGEKAALEDLGSRLAFNPSRSRMAGNELERFRGRALCEVAKIRSLTGTDYPIVILNGTTVLREWPLCGWTTDEIALIEWGSNPCTDRTQSVALLLGVECGGGARTPASLFGQQGRRSGTAAGGYVIIWTRP